MKKEGLPILSGRHFDLVNQWTITKEEMSKTQKSISME